ncbi:tripartite tricarboxylate transporter substrate binding protein [Roseomonas terrae]|jgi:tripartite-type tricarboxylate transporter receptor subunit TctC|uniref:Tripartite tricarboxylate transporter substrate binding protein n=1 Tax=Neoroseomonas terrae TaxID=424799 RepID=A0ABS5EB07_9PROT|nr:tripartite tricarboxylate transporter substrate binding protein [Neoroseomonas terrae]MBR0648205.1 tripartite tricarboxylate transporter substrate binding protein [Neoroseomonas terrae]
MKHVDKERIAQAPTLRRRSLPALGFAAIAAPALAQETWPARPIRLVIPFAPGGPIDTVGRLIGERLREKLGQPFIIDNRAGAGGSIGLRSVVQSPPDGYHFVLTSSSLAILPAIYANLGFDPRTDLTPVSLVAEIATTIVVRADHRFATLQDLVAEARAKPGIITYGTSGIGSSNHLSGAMLASVARIDLTHVPYRGAAQATNALYAGDIDVVFASTVETLGQVREGRARILAVTTASRIPFVPEVPAAVEIVTGYIAPNWFAIAAPKGLPEPILARMSAELIALRGDADFRARFATLGAEPLMSTPDVLAARLAEDVPTWRRVAAEAGIRAE